MKKFVVFDLDNTLVDSLHLKPLRDRRQWANVYSSIQTVEPFEGITELWTRLRDRGLHLAVVTHSPGSYARRTLAQVALAPDTIVAYHDLAGKRKPLPYGYELGCKGLLARNGVAVGDEPNDLLAADAFGCVGVFAGWSRNPTLTEADCERAGWIYAPKPSALLCFLDSIRES
jgi:phosphoglycolate phosphatase-like HAD superfamily hydrolase